MEANIKIQNLSRFYILTHTFTIISSSMTTFNLNFSL
ncbi:unnamed protein product, partial [Arabidopsis halleri]